MKAPTTHKTILYVTAAFPWPQSESFLIPEINTLANHGDRLIVLPTRIIDPPLELPDELHSSVELEVVPLFQAACVIAFFKLFTARPKFTLGLISRLFGTGTKKGIKNLVVLPKAAYFAERLNDLNVDHIHAHWAGVSSSLAYEISEISGVSFSVTAHRWDVSENNLLKLKSEQASFMRFISEKERQLAITLGAQSNKSFCIPMGVPTGGIPPRTYPKHDTTWQLVCIAAFLEIKGHDYLFQAFECLLTKGLDAHLTLIGDGPLKQPLKGQYSHLSTHLTFEGNLPHSEVMQRLASGYFHIGVLGSITDRHGEYEGVPVCLMEMIAAGIPVVSTQTGSIDELVPTELMLTAPEKNARALADCIEHLMTNPTHYETASHQLSAIVHEKYNGDANTLTLRTHIHNA